MIRKFLSIFALVFVASGCATMAKGPLFTLAPSSAEHKSVLYVFHEKSSMFSSQPMVKINDEPFVALPSLGYSYVYLSPGIYRLSFDYGYWNSGFITEIEIKAGEDAFIVYSNVGGVSQGVKNLSSDAIESWGKKYHYVEPIDVKNKNFNAEQK